jgi:hypothetical protein
VRGFASSSVRASLSLQQNKGSSLPLPPTSRAVTIDATEDGILFTMKLSARAVSILVSRHALEDIDPQPFGAASIARFNKYRSQFEQIASDKFDKGHLERDGSVCIRGRDLPGRGH